MRVLVTGGTGVIGEGLLPALLEAGHEVRLLSRGAEADARQWPGLVEPFPADVTDPRSLRGAAEGCHAVVHVTGIVEESKPDLTFERVNVRGTKNVLDEAERAGVRRFVYVSSLGAERGRSGYHKSKLSAEKMVGASKTDWLILRPGNVYGPGDDVISTLLKLIRALPAAPVIGGGGQRFQPVWHEDLGRAIAGSLARPELKRRTLELAGEEVTTTNDLIDRLSAITGRKVARVPVPSWLASLGVQVAGMAKLESLLGVRVPLNDAKLKMLLEGNVVRPPHANALSRVLGVTPTPLDEGLRRLADMIPEQFPSEGVGPLLHKRFWADIRGSRLTPTALVEAFRERCAEVMPLEFSAEPGTPRVIEEGVTLTLALPLRGNVQVRVEEVAARRVTFATVEGHMLAGVIRFTAAGERRGEVRFSVEIHARAATALDWLALNTVGDSLQRSNWEQVVGRVVELSGGSAPAGVRGESETLSDDEARRVQRLLKDLVNRRKRAGLQPPRRTASGKSAKALSAAKKSRAAATPARPAAGAAPARDAVKSAPSKERAADGVLPQAARAVSTLAASALKAAAAATAGRKSARKSRKPGR
ncbi:MAG TPA: NAD-dependent epimerase/dehydratase family protein [Pyrinomonadaceae bacterium]|jgi:NADH dehydrogenase